MIDPVAFTIFGISVAWYGIIIASAILIGVFLAIKEAKRRGIDADLMLDAFIWIVPIAIICARLYYVAFEWNAYSGNLISILYIWEGGLAIYGAVIGGAIALYLFCRHKKISFVQIVDIIAPSLVLGQAMGRWGNFVNQEAYGTAVTDTSLQWFPYAVFIEKSGPNGTWHLATFFYESIWCFIVFGILLWYQKKKQKTAGNVMLWYLVLYGIERAFVEGLRTDSLWLIPDVIRISQVVSIGLVIVAGAALIYNNYIKKKKHTISI